MNLMQRFEEKYIPEPNSGCWLWTASTHRSGYGQIIECENGLKKNLRAPRVAWKLYKGEIPEGKCVCHKCDVRLCVNPDHLFLGNSIENMNDMKLKDRRKPTPLYNKLDSSKVREILLCPEISGANFSRKFKVTEACISLVRNRKTWQEVFIQ